MHIPRVFLDQALSEQQQITLDAEASHHLVTVLRVKPGRDIVLFNGLGGEYRARLLEPNKRAALVAVNTFVNQDKESPLSLHLGVCLIKNDRFDWLLQKATELGVTAITPLVSQFTTNKISTEKLAKKMKHWEKVIISASEQSERTRLPQLHAPQSLALWQSERQEMAKFILHPSVSACLGDVSAPLSSAALLVGPEGGFADEEVMAATKAEFRSISLGPRILRAETAPLVAISLMQHQFGDIP